MILLKMRVNTLRLLPLHPRRPDRLRHPSARPSTKRPSSLRAHLIHEFIYRVLLRDVHPREVFLQLSVVDLSRRTPGLRRKVPRTGLPREMSLLFMVSHFAGLSAVVVLGQKEEQARMQLTRIYTSCG